MANYQGVEIAQNIWGMYLTLPALTMNLQLLKLQLAFFSTFSSNDHQQISFLSVHSFLRIVYQPTTNIKFKLIKLLLVQIRSIKNRWTSSITMVTLIRANDLSV